MQWSVPLTRGTPAAYAPAAPRVAVRSLRSFDGREYRQPDMAKAQFYRRPLIWVLATSLALLLYIIANPLPPARLTVYSRIEIVREIMRGDSRWHGVSLSRQVAAPNSADGKEYLLAGIVNSESDRNQLLGLVYSNRLANEMNIVISVQDTAAPESNRFLPLGTVQVEQVGGLWRPKSGP